MFAVVDDDLSIRQSFDLLFPGLTVHALSIADGIRLVSDLQPVIVFLDVWFPASALTGVDAVPLFQHAAPDAAVILLTADAEVPELARAIRDYGAAAYVEKGDPDAIRRVTEVTLLQLLRRRDRRREIAEKLQRVFDVLRASGAPAARRRVH